ncbi:MAG TPA: hypothetical protein VKZ18_23885 [Polyangia bacterium]|nr:hypothetical protein [Polyangia bacterium]
MIRPSRRWTSLSAPAAATLVFAALAARATPAAAQACCAGGALVNPVRLSPPEDYAVGVQTRVRSDVGSFGADGTYVSSATFSEQDVEQDLAASFRVARRAQVGLVLPYVETHRSEPGVDEWGSGLGDIALNARYDFKLAAEMTYWPGFALLGGVVFPTGKAVGDGTNATATDATGTGTFNASLGISLEKVHGPLYGALNVWGTYSGASSTPSAAGTITTSYPLQLTALAVAGYVFESEAAAALYINFLERGDTTVNGTTQSGSELRLTTVGATGMLPVAESWRLSASLYADVLASSFGRNEQGGVGGTISLVRAWR